MNEFPLEDIPPEKLALYNGIVGKCRDIAFDVNGMTHEFLFCNAHKQYEATTFIRVKIGDQFMVVGIESMPTAAFFSKDYAEVDFNVLPAEVKPIFIESLVGGILSLLEESFGVRVSIEAVSQEPFQDEGEFSEQLYFVTESDEGQNTIRGHIKANLSGLEFLMSMLPGEAGNYEHALSEVDMLAHVIIGREALSYREYRGVGVNDIVLLSNGIFMNSGACEVVLGDKIGFNATYQGGIITLKEEGKAMIDEDQNEFIDSNQPEEHPHEVGQEMPEAHHEEEAQEPLNETVAEEPEVDGLPVHLRFEVGEKRIPVDELQQLQAGYTFELETALEEPVTIRANGKSVGKGELVKIGERVGVRVTQLKG